MKTLVLGGARSGKSRYAEKLASQTGRQVIYIATATAGDKEMQLRIKQHQAQRPEKWVLIEEPLALSDCLAKYINSECCLLIDCLTLWLSNQLAQPEEQSSEAALNKTIGNFISQVDQMQCELIMVSNEVGQGVVPMGELSRRFVDESGRLHQQLADVCDQVVFTIAGLPQILKSPYN